MNVIDRLDEARRATDVLEHPFYVRWSEGSLGERELALYAGEYRRAVIALADASAAAADHAEGEHAAGLARHAEEERSHVALWDDFAAACGAVEPARELAGTRECVRAWTAGQSLLEHLAVLYAIEAGQPQVSATKLEGLREHYEQVPEGPAREYFRLHAYRDVEHARAARELIEELIDESDDPDAEAQRMLARAEAALRGNWRLLDDVEAAA